MGFAYLVLEIGLQLHYLVTVGSRLYYLNCLRFRFLSSNVGIMVPLSQGCCDAEAGQSISSTQQQQMHCTQPRHTDSSPSPPPLTHSSSLKLSNAHILMTLSELFAAFKTQEKGLRHRGFGHEEDHQNVPWLSQLPFWGLLFLIIIFCIFRSLWLLLVQVLF